MARAGLFAGVAACFQLMARPRPPFVDATRHFLADGAGQRRAARLRVVGAAHPAQGVGDFDCQTGRHLSAVFVEFVN